MQLQPNKLIQFEYLSLPQHLLSDCLVEEAGDIFCVGDINQQRQCRRCKDPNEQGLKLMDTKSPPQTSRIIQSTAKIENGHKLINICVDLNSELLLRLFGCLKEQDFNRETFDDTKKPQRNASVASISRGPNGPSGRWWARNASELENDQKFMSCICHHEDVMMILCM